MSDLVERLRSVKYAMLFDGWSSNVLAIEAADLIQRQQTALEYIANSHASLVEENRRKDEEIVRLRETLSDLERYVSMECYDQWLPDGHAKTSVLTRKLDIARAALQPVAGKEG